MSQTATTAAGWTARLHARVAQQELDRRLFVAGVGTITVAVAVFLLVQLDGWPPHEDETLPLFVGRQPLGDLFDIVLGRRGGAPLHFLLAWVVAHAGGGLHTMRLFSALFAVGSLPAIAALGNRLGGRGPALAATALAAASWVLLFHGIYARMYSLFLFLSTLSYLALLRALERGGRSWLWWGAVTLLTIGSHPYGALVLASQGLYVVLTRRRLRQAVPAFAAVGVIAIPLWKSSVVLANRFDVGVGGGGSKLGTPRQVLDYLWRVAGDASSGYTGVLVVVLILAGVGLAYLARQRPSMALLIACVVVTPTLFFLVGRFGGSSAPESRHLIFALPFLALATGAGALAAGRPAGPLGVWVGALLVAVLIPAEVAWGWHKTPAMFTSENAVRVAARAHAAAWLAADARPNDVLFAYEPLYLAAWESNRSSVSRTVIPRADPNLTLQALEDARKPLGRGVWVFDAGDNNNYVKRTQVELRVPFPRREFEGRVYGPYLVIRTRRPTVTIAHYLDDARKVELIGKSLAMGDADINYATIRRVQVRLAVRSRASVS
ncbi:MAG TPA: glycosyltransferase family 39 protein [Gaiellaceae bacterium]|nr:glycosyltransferase family 39 protein [Gaiellaceae bacterium]